MTPHSETVSTIRTRAGVWRAAEDHDFLRCANCCGMTFFALLRRHAGGWKVAGFVCSDTSCARTIRLEN